MPARTASPQLDFVDETKPDQSKRAEQYSEKFAVLLGYGLRATVEKEALLPDAAALIEHGPAWCDAMGTLADKDENVRRAVDFITKGTDNPYLAAVAATMPLVLQIIRNHENTEFEKPVRIKIPFLRREWKFPARFKIRLRNPFARAATVEPAVLVQKVFSEPDIVTALQAQGMNVAWKGATSPNGTATSGRRKQS